MWCRVRFCSLAPDPNRPCTSPATAFARAHIDAILALVQPANCLFHSAVYCQILDSIFRMYPLITADRADADAPFAVDVPMSRVKFNANTEYQYLQNFKVLQSTSGLAVRSDAHVAAH